MNLREVLRERMTSILSTYEKERHTKRILFHLISAQHVEDKHIKEMKIQRNNNHIRKITD
jgi:hypothetical protein